ncbi:MAG: hypothetical protein U0Q07_19485 [Acidimicrobiales bacterium]
MQPLPLPPPSPDPRAHAPAPDPGPGPDPGPDPDPAEAPVPGTTGAPGAPLTLDDLEAVARNLTALSGLVPELDPPVVVGSSSSTDEVAVRPLEGDDPVSGLVGERVPDHWDLVALVATGRTYALDADRPTDSARAHRGAPVGRVLFTHVVARTGASAAMVQPFDGEPQLLPSAPGAPAGRADDALRRMLDLPTAPPTHDVAELWALQWVDAVLAAAHRDPARPLRWPEVARLHPAARVAARDPLLASLLSGDLVRLGRAFARVTPWSFLRHDCAVGRWSVEGIDAAAAAWMDDGMFSRWTMQAFPFLEDELDDLDDLLPPAVADQVRSALAGWDLV